MTERNRLMTTRPGKHTRNAGLHLQDAYHEFDAILGGGMFSPQEQTMMGRLELYGVGRQELESAMNEGDQEHRLPQRLVDDILNPFKLPPANEIKDERELKAKARIGKGLAEKLGDAIGIDPDTGEPPREW
jgi:hypothetical protein